MRATLQNGASLGEYRIVELLGAGGMGEVYRARHERLGRDVAVKVLAAEHGGDDAVRFENEARIQAVLTHDNLAALYDYVELQGLRCLVMEYVPGESLADRLRRTGRLAPAEALSILRQIAGAAACMHRNGVVHRDLKPSNVRIDGGGRVKVLDFGIAKARNTPGLTAAGAVIGTPAYASPEQLRTGAVTPQSDVWAMGILLYEMATGRPPFRGTVPSQVWEAISRSPREPVTAHVQSADGERIERIVTRCLAIDPRQRYADADALLAVLSGAGAPDALPPEIQPGERMTAAAHVLARQWAWLAAGALIALAIALFSSGGGSAPDAVRTPHRIDTTGGSAEVVINGTSFGRTPIDYEAAPGEMITLELRRPGASPLVERFDVSSRGAWTFTLRAEPEDR